MITETIILQVDPDAASIFKSASSEEREKLQVLLGIWLRQLGKDQSLSLRQTIDEISDKAKARGLTAEALEEILEEE
jgi:hypothetical protein